MISRDPARHLSDLRHRAPVSSGRAHSQQPFNSRCQLGPTDAVRRVQVKHIVDQRNLLAVKFEGIQGDVVWIVWRFRQKNRCNVFGCSSV